MTKVFTAGYSFFIEEEGHLYKLFANGFERVTTEFIRSDTKWIHQKTRIVLSEQVSEVAHSAAIKQYEYFKAKALEIESPSPCFTYGF